MNQDARDKMKVWQAIPPETCKCATHFSGDKPLPYEKVCQREQAWRDYVRARGEPSFNSRYKIARIQPQDEQYLASVHQIRGEGMH